MSALSSTAAFELWRRNNADALADIRSPDEITHQGISVSPAEPWVTALLLIGFDLDKGQVVEECVPENVLTFLEKEAVCYHAMPDSSAGGKGHEDALYSFRIQREVQDGGKGDHTLLLAHCIFRQAPDNTNTRGFFQKAVVVVSSVPCVHLYNVLLSTLASKVFVEGGGVLHKAVEDISTWPDPRALGDSRILQLPLMGETIVLSIPQLFLQSFAAPTASCVARCGSPSPTTVACQSFSGSDERNASSIRHTPSHAAADTPALVRSWPLCAPSSQAASAPFHEVQIVQALKGVLEKVSTIWELMLLGEHLLVFGATPSQCSAAVLSVLGLIHPLPFIGDWRPYFCIQDSTYPTLAGAEKASDVLPNGALYGVTNSHMADTLPFPHILSLPGVESSGKNYKVGLKTTYRPLLYRSRQVMNIVSHTLVANRKGNASADVIVSDIRSSIFDCITRPFLRAFDRYLVPTWGGHPVTEEPYASDPFGRWLGLLQLHVENFPTSEDLASPGVMALFRSAASRSRIRSFYQRFVHSPVFGAWWPEAHGAAERECVAMHRTDLLEACVRGTGSGLAARDDAVALECILDLTMRVGEELDVCEQNDNELKSKLKGLQESLEGRDEGYDYIESASERSDEPLLLRS